jgi:hypothetical protein
MTTYQKDRFNALAGKIIVTCLDLEALAQVMQATEDEFNADAIMNYCEDGIKRINDLSRFINL